MKLSIKHQENYSRGELLLRTFFGIFYILIPHGLLMIFPVIGASILVFLAFWAILFTGKFPKSWFDYIVKLFRWSLRVVSRFANLVDGYPEFGLKPSDEKVTFELEYPEKLSRGKLLLKFFFGYFYVLIPHFIALLIRGVWVFIQLVITWFSILFTGKFPKSFHEGIVGCIRWYMRVMFYMWFMTDEYPKFSGKE